MLFDNNNGNDYPNAVATPPTFAVSTTQPITSSQGILYNSPLLTFNGLNAIDLGYAYRNDPTGLGVAAVGRTGFWVEFDYYGSDFAFYFTSDTANTTGFWLWADGIPQTTAIHVPTTTGNSNLYYRVTFPTVANRRLRIYIHKADIGSFYIGPKDTISKVNITRPRIVMYGDSWIAYNGTATPDPKDNFAQRLAYMLNADIYLCAIGGSGYNSGTYTFTNTTRLAAVKTINPDLIFIQGSINDGTDTTNTVTNFNTVMNSFKTNLPNVPVIMAGVQGTMIQSTGNTTNNTNMLAAAANFSNIIGTIDTLGGTWISGNGYAGNPTSTGNGNYFIDATSSHLNATGAQYWAKRMYGSIVNIMKAGIN